MDNRRLPTRVSNACDRCRRQKQRCDNFRPCGNCVKTNRTCEQTETRPSLSKDEPRVKRARTATTRSSSPQSNAVGRQSHPQSPISPNHHYTTHPTQDRAQARSIPDPRNEDPTWQEHSIVAEFGDSSSAMDITRRVLRHRASDHGSERATFAIPGGDLNIRPSAQETHRSVRDLVGIDLPPRETCDKLIDTYFFTVHWFSLVVHEPTFRKRYEAIATSGSARTTDRPFLLLLLMVLALSCQYAHSFAEIESSRELDLTNVRVEYLKIVRQNFMDLLDEDSLEFVQICILLGSYWLYWGKPRSSFSILGACVKSAQAIYLHRQSSRRPVQHNFDAIEERKRVWWTIYTWDRFATIVYGRPLGISDRHCDVQMPAVFTEYLLDIETSLTAHIELSLYQTQLNQIYQIASPLLEDIYGIRSSGDKSLLEMAERTKKIDKAMQAWNHNLPDKMNLDSYVDIKAQSSLETKMHQLQSLSLQLTYQNLMIIIHRPLLADWSQRRGRESRTQSIYDNTTMHQGPAMCTESEVYERSFQSCLKAALAISRIEQNQPNLLRLAGKTHLVSFLGMNLFTSSVVLFICALSNVLSDAAQEAKRGIARNVRVLKSLSNAGSLSSQCTMIIEDLVQMIIDKERKQMLLGRSASEGNIPASEREEWNERSSDMEQPNRHEGNFTTNTESTNQVELPAYMSSFTSAVGANGSLERTMETLHKVIKDASYSRVVQSRSDLEPTQTVSVTRPTTDNPMWASDWIDPGVYHPQAYPADDLQSQDMGQFWLWEIGSHSEDLSSWGMEYHL